MSETDLDVPLSRTAASASARPVQALEIAIDALDIPAVRPFWVLADTEGNEACVCTWTDRDEREH